MDKLLNSSWFVKIIAFLLALMMYTVVSMETTQEATNRTFWTKMYKESETLQNIPIKPYFNEQNFVLTDLPASVDVTLSGSSRLITKAIKVDKNFEAYIDLTNKKPGDNRVKVQVNGLPDGVEAKVKPAYVNVTLHKKITKEIPVNVDLKNTKKLPEGYTAGDVDYTPKSVKVTGAEGMVNQISFISGYVDVGKANEAVRAKVPLRAYNQQGDLIDVKIDPAVADVKVPINKPQKTVPISIETKGQLEEGLKLVSITSSPKELTLTGTTSALNQYDAYKGISIDLSKIKKDTNVTVDVPVPDGIEAVSKKEVTVTVDVEEQNVTKTFSDVPLTLQGVNDKKKATFIDPAEGKVDVTVKGEKEALDSLKKTDLQGIVDVSKLEQGKYDVKIDWKNPADIDLTDAVQEASVEIQTETSSQ
ncbi:CdaR family protein [Fictibacillus barbaricus]|uniref:YbbR domain-containing protein n=1 Tax=Fictibacillus barbaricus TaxID=182136 RepID=A0ABU1U645_9BACL|nr:CdaR family protein [Fictibacillus barbaricus]MDR7074944.1 YbbR domain-containing protein [Fictibacillus barbaricus]